MAFPNNPHSDIRARDGHGSEAAVVAQLLYMGGKLGSPYNPSAFDRIVRRNPGASLLDATWLRVIGRQLPTVHVWAVGPEGFNKAKSRTEIQALLQRVGWPPKQISQYFRSDVFTHRQSRAADLNKAAAELSNRHTTVICNDAAWRAQGFLARGEVVLAPDFTDPLLTPMLLVRGKGKSLIVYRGRNGLSTTTLRQLTTRKAVDLNYSGFMAITRN